MKIGVIGGGRVGGALAATWSERGHDVVVSTRETVAETAAASDVVVLAVSAAAAPDALAAAAGALDGKVVVDATNNLSGGPSAAEIATLAPAARFVKAFNTVFSTFMHDTPPSPPASLVYCGDDAEAKETVAQLIVDAGFEPVDAGRLPECSAGRGVREACHRTRVHAGSRSVRVPVPEQLTDIAWL